MKQILLVSAIALSVSACATKPPRLAQLRTPPPDRLLAYQSVSDGDSTVQVVRDIGSMGSACYHAVFVDGKVAAKLATGEVATFHVPPGEHVLGTWTTGSGLCGFREGADRRETSVILKPGEMRKFRLTIVPDAGPSINPTTM